MTNFTDIIKFQSPVSIHSHEQSWRIETLNLHAVNVTNRSQRWRIEMKTQTSRDPEVIGKLMEIIASNHKSSSFTVEMPQIPDSLEAEGSPTLAANLLVGDTSVTLGSPPTLKGGRFVTFGSQKKVYYITPSSTAGVFNVMPRIIQAVASGTQVNLTPNIDCFFTDDATLGITFDSNQRVMFSVMAIENLS